MYATDVLPEALDLHSSRWSCSFPTERGIPPRCTGIYKASPSLCGGPGYGTNYRQRQLAPFPRLGCFSTYTAGWSKRLWEASDQLSRFDHWGPVGKQCVRDGAVSSGLRLLLSRVRARSVVVLAFHASERSSQQSRRPRHPAEGDGGRVDVCRIAGRESD